LSDCQQKKKKKENHDNIVTNGKCADILSDGVNGDASYYENHVVTGQDMFYGYKVNIICQV
jgi:hypothetical protein